MSRLSGLKRFNNRSFLVMTAFGFLCGLPLNLSGFTLRQWLTEGGTSLQFIGLTANIGIAYTLKFLWAPLLDQVRPPGLLGRLGRRRGWLMAIQPVLAGSALLLAFSDPVNAPVITIAAAAVIAFLSASQDIVVDAWRVEIFSEKEQSFALGGYIWGYRVALLIAGAGAIGLADKIGWRAALIGVAALLLSGVIATALAREPPVRPQQTQPPAMRDRLRRAVIEPFTEFWHRPGSGRVLAFVMLFKLGEALAHTMAVPFYRAMGFDRAQVALTNGIPALIASLVGIAAGGWLVIRLGTGRTLILTGFAQMASMTLYFALALSGGDVRILLAKVMVENVAEGMADAAFITYLSSLCAPAFTATQYALLSSLSAVGLRTFGGLSGVLAAALGWTQFYALTILAALPAMLIMLTLINPVAPTNAASRQ